VFNTTLPGSRAYVTGSAAPGRAGDRHRISCPGDEVKRLRKIASELGLESRAGRERHGEATARGGTA